MTTTVARLPVFISWAGPWAESVGKGFRDFLPDAVNAIDLFLSASDIDKGSRWGSVLSSSLQSSACAIVCLTRESLDSTWVAFETGAISRAAGGPDGARSRIWTYLLGLNLKELQLSPFAEYQGTASTREETWELIRSINRLSPDSTPEDSLRRRFDGSFWPNFSVVLKEHQKSVLSSPQTSEASELDLLSEVLLTVRTIQHEIRRASASGMNRRSPWELLFDAIVRRGIPAEKIETTETELTIIGSFPKVSLPSSVLATVERYPTSADAFAEGIVKAMERERTLPTAQA